MRTNERSIKNISSVYRLRSRLRNQANKKIQALRTINFSINSILSNMNAYLFISFMYNYNNNLLSALASETTKYYSNESKENGDNVCKNKPFLRLKVIIHWGHLVTTRAGPYSGYSQQTFLTYLYLFIFNYCLRTSEC